MPTADDKELRISIRVPRATYEQIKKAAARDHRTMAGWVKALIATALEGESSAVTKKR
jgi:predicted DNA-binding protein